MRKPLIAGNWKMFLTLPESLALAKELALSDIEYKNVDVIIAPSYTNLYAVGEVVKDVAVPIGVAAQNVYWQEEGAFTGEISAAMLASCGASTVIIGHSERRTLFNESDYIINKKVHTALANGLGAILCVGEQWSERDSGEAFNTVLAQLKAGLAGVSGADICKVTVAYEPVWAIGTGKTATSADASDMHSTIRRCIEDAYGVEIAQSIRIIYGGSVKPDNVSSFMGHEDIDGVLVGGASLKSSSFLDIINYYR